ncbi:hypothetical protein [Bradyrhizobium sp. USDA 4469]
MESTRLGGAAGARVQLQTSSGIFASRAQVKKQQVSSTCSNSMPPGNFASS